MISNGISRRPSLRGRFISACWWDESGMSRLAGAGGSRPAGSLPEQPGPPVPAQPRLPPLLPGPPAAWLCLTAIRGREQEQLHTFLPLCPCLGELRILTPASFPPSAPFPSDSGEFEAGRHRCSRPGGAGHLLPSCGLTCPLLDSLLLPDQGAELSNCR